VDTDPIDEPLEPAEGGLDPKHAVGGCLFLPVVFAFLVGLVVLVMPCAGVLDRALENSSGALEPDPIGGALASLRTRGDRLCERLASHLERTGSPPGDLDDLGVDLDASPHGPWRLELGDAERGEAESTLCVTVELDGSEQVLTRSLDTREWTLHERGR